MFGIDSSARGSVTVKLDATLTTMARVNKERGWWKDYLDLAAGQCCYCLGHVGCHELTADHIAPFCTGGRFNVTNILPVCHACNARKADRSLASFASCVARGRHPLGRLRRGRWQWSFEARLIQRKALEGAREFRIWHSLAVGVGILPARRVVPLPDPGSVELLMLCPG